MPTELLAEQHAQTLTRLLAPVGIVPILLTGSLPARERKAIAARLESGEPALVVGTHGRSIWVLDDAGPLEALTADAMKASATLLPVPHAHRSSAGNGPGSFVVSSG